VIFKLFVCWQIPCEAPTVFLKGTCDKIIVKIVAILYSIRAYFTDISVLHIGIFLLELIVMSSENFECLITRKLDVPENLGKKY